MNKIHFCTARLGCASFLLLGCLDAPPEGRSPGTGGREKAPQIPSGNQGDHAISAKIQRQFLERLLEIARTYPSYRRENAAMDFKLAIRQCSFALTSAPSFPQDESPDLTVSSSRDASTHGMKLYLLFAKLPLPNSVVDVPARWNPVGQSVVKETWLPEEIKDDGKPLKVVRRKVKVATNNGLEERVEKFVPYVRKDFRLYHACKRAGLFIMFKVDPKTPGTDEGWVYGTVTADLKNVTSAGTVPSCMKCHQKAPYDRLFGLARRY
jgi:hypothetical protein